FFHCVIRAVSGGKRVAEMQREQSQMRRHEHFVAFVLPLSAVLQELATAITNVRRAGIQARKKTRRVKKRFWRHGMQLGKSLLLASAAGLVAIAGAQAADLPVKAKPVEYVKICSLYGVGFYYIPGTDMCIKIGGWVRAEYGWGNNGNFTWGWANGNVNNRTTNNSDFRARGYITADAPDQTRYRTVRGYIAVGLSENEHGGDVNASTAFSANRAFIQWAGFTFGRAQSFFDFYSNPATSYWGSFPSSDTGDGGWFVMGYTAQFGNGWSATISAEAPRKTQIIDGFLIVTPTPVNAYGGFQAPDVVANLRVDQAW